MGEEQSLSIEETNKLRISLGLKPLSVDPPAGPGPSSSSTTATTTGDPNAPQPDDSETGFEADERRAVQNWQQRASELEKVAARERQKETIRKAKETARRFAKLEGKGLGEADDDEDGEGKDGGVDGDAVEWVKKMKKRQKRIARKMEAEIAERERAALGGGRYTEEDVRGLRVAHDREEFGEGEDVVLTLKDATIDELEEEGDELENVELNEREKLKEKLELKKKKPVYNAYDDDMDESGNRRLLAQYDDEDAAKAKKKKFVIEDTPEGVQARKESVAEKLKQGLISLETEKTEASDYLDPSTLRVRKHKKKKARSTRKKDDEDTLAPLPEPTESDPSGSAMDIDETPAPSTLRSTKRNLEDMSFVDDEELQTALALQRRTTLKKRKILKPEDIAKQVKEEQNGSESPGLGEGEVKQEGEDEDVGLVIDETTEFVSNLRAPVIPERKRRRSSASAQKAAVTKMQDEDEDEDEDEAGVADKEGDVDMDRNQLEELDGVPGPSSSVPVPADITSTGLDEEHVLSRGIGATLAMLNQRGLLQRNAESEKLLELQREKERFQAEKKLKQLEAEQRARMQREQDRKSGIFDKMSAKEREEYARWENKQRDQQEAKDMAARFKDYKPNVQLTYKDEFGRDMSKKEAFKYLSHQFHGKGSGKAKTEKRLKKIEDEKKREAASTLQSATEGLTSSMADKAKKSKQAGVRLM
ncbi:SART-1 protein [Peziza echinospora]|nr:SART-1 protein [Peziza echinospora]